MAFLATDLRPPRADGGERITRLAAETEQPAELRTRRQAVEAFYASRNDAPLWLDKGQWTDAAKAAVKVVRSKKT